MPVTEKAYAKLNLTLAVTGKRADGYHEIRTVMQTVDWCDLVTVDRQETGIALSLSDPALPTDAHNTAYAAAQQFLKQDGCPLSGVSIHIEKQIPREAGLAGGSADAAAVLRAMNRLSGDWLPLEQLAALGTAVGADVPFCVVRGAALCTGIGEKMQPLPSLIERVWVTVVKPPVGVSTKAAYAAVDAVTPDRAAEQAAEQAVCAALIAGEIPPVLYNAFETALAVPEVAAARRALEQCSPCAVCMSGSGSAVYALFETETAARAAAKRLSACGETFVCHPIA